MQPDFHLYAIALGSNRPHGRHGRPDAIVRAAFIALATLGRVTATSSIHRTPAFGPAGRDFANAAALLETQLSPESLLAALKRIERDFGRRAGRRWGPRVLDLDILLWDGGTRRGRWLSIPHPLFAKRAFVLDPLVEIAADWRVPALSARVRHLRHRHGKLIRRVAHARHISNARPPVTRPAMA